MTARVPLFDGLLPDWPARLQQQINHLRDTRQALYGRAVAGPGGQELSVRTGQALDDAVESLDRLGVLLQTIMAAAPPTPPELRFNGTVEAIAMPLTVTALTHRADTGDLVAVRSDGQVFKSWGGGPWEAHTHRVPGCGVEPPGQEGTL